MGNDASSYPAVVDGTEAAHKVSNGVGEWGNVVGKCYICGMRGLVYVIALMVITVCGCVGRSDMHGLDEAGAMLQRDPAKALELLNGYDVSTFGDSADMARWALLYSEAMVANRLAAPTDTIINIAISYYGRHNDPAALGKARQIKALMDAVSNERDALATALYLQKEKEFMLYKERSKRERLVLVVLIVGIIAVSVIVRQRQRLRLNDAQTRALMAEASRLNDGLRERQTECSALNARLSASLANRFGMIDELCGTYYESQGTKAEKKAIVDKVKSHIEALAHDEGIFSDMESCHEELLCRFRQDIPGLKPEEYRLMVYLASGLSNRTIALLIGESIDVAYKRKSRLKAKISQSSSPDKALFLSKF